MGSLRLPPFAGVFHSTIFQLYLQIIRSFSFKWTPCSSCVHSNLFSARLISFTLDSQQITDNIRELTNLEGEQAHLFTFQKVSVCARVDWHVRETICIENYFQSWIEGEIGRTQSIYWNVTNVWIGEKTECPDFWGFGCQVLCCWCYLATLSWSGVSGEGLNRLLIDYTGSTLTFFQKGFN